MRHSFRSFDQGEHAMEEIGELVVILTIVCGIGLLLVHMELKRIRKILESK